MVGNSVCEIRRPSGGGDRTRNGRLLRWLIRCQGVSNRMRRTAHTFVLLGSGCAVALYRSPSGAKLLCRCETIDSVCYELRTQSRRGRVVLLIDASLAQIRVIDGLPSTTEARA